MDPVTSVKTHPVFYGSVPSMFGKPISEGPQDLEAFDIAYLGIPWSAPPSAGRSASIAQFAGTTLTPNSMRTNSIKYGGYLPELDVDVFERFGFTDYGNVDVTFDVKESWANIENKVSDIVAAGCMAFTMGGNGGGASFPVLKAIAGAVPGKVAVVNFDAHGDNYIETGEERFSKRNPRWGSSWARRILADIPNVDPKLYTHVGLRGPRNDGGSSSVSTIWAYPERTSSRTQTSRHLGATPWSNLAARSPNVPPGLRRCGSPSILMFWT